MTDDDLAPLVAATYLALADRLDRLPASAWDATSMCAGWRVREVVAHMTMPSRYDEETFMAELREDQFDFSRLSNRLATRDAELPPEFLVQNLRDQVLHRWTPPGGGHRGALNHVVIHSLDVTVPLGEPSAASGPALRATLDDLTAGGAHGHFGTDIEGRRLYATDIEWTYGEGPPLSGSAADLALHLCGRMVPASRLHGEPLRAVSHS